MEPGGHFQSFYLAAELGPRIAAAFSGRSITRERLFDFYDALNIVPDRVRYVTQVHGNRVIQLRDPNLPTEAIEADALMTHLPGVTLGIRTADCLPVFLAGEDQRTIALVHCGWRSLRAGILEKVVESFWTDYGTPAREIRVFFGPAIRRCCYEVGKEFENFFPREFLIPCGEKYRFDLPGEALRRLWERGVPAENYRDSGYCTSCQNGQFYSARREKTGERIYSLLQILV